MPSASCPECGAPVPEDGSCRDNFHALLLLEAHVPGAPGGLPHFLAVAAYNLQHPESVPLTAEALAGLRAAVADILAGRATLDQVRRRARRGAAEAGRVTRRAGEVAPSWGVAVCWPMTIAEVCGAGAEGYTERVECWASSIVRTLDRLGPL